VRTVIVEIAVERYHFVCGHCGYEWTADYDVQYLRDYSGEVLAFYRLNGAPVEPPPEDVIICPRCGEGPVRVELIGRRDVPIASLDSDEPRQKVATTPEERRASAPYLDAHDVGTSRP
jgi:ribosomal protein S27AE